MGKDWLRTACFRAGWVADRAAKQAYSAFPQPLGFWLQGALFGVQDFFERRAFELKHGVRAARRGHCYGGCAERPFDLDGQKACECWRKRAEAATKAGCVESQLELEARQEGNKRFLRRLARWMFVEKMGKGAPTPQMLYYCDVLNAVNQAAETGRGIDLDRYAVDMLNSIIRVNQMSTSRLCRRLAAAAWAREAMQLTAEETARISSWKKWRENALWSAQWFDEDESMYAEAEGRCYVPFCNRKARKNGYCKTHAVKGGDSA